MTLTVNLTESEIKDAIKLFLEARGHQTWNGGISINTTTGNLDGSVSYRASATLQYNQTLPTQNAGS